MLLRHVLADEGGGASHVLAHADAFLDASSPAWKGVMI
jgi:hypothetical protein